MPAVNFSYTNKYVFSVYFGVSEYINSNEIIKLNYATCNYLGYNYVNIMTRVNIMVIMQLSD